MPDSEKHTRTNGPSDLPPIDHKYDASLWLGQRHPELGHLADRIDGLYAWPVSGPVFDLDSIADTIRENDRHTVAFDEYAGKNPPPSNDDEWGVWVDNGPQPTGLGKKFGALSSKEQSRLRLLATLSTARVELRWSDLAGMDGGGQSLIRDWVAILVQDHALGHVDILGLTR